MPGTTPQPHMDDTTCTHPEASGLQFSRRAAACRPLASHTVHLGVLREDRLRIPAHALLARWQQAAHMPAQVVCIAAHLCSRQHTAHTALLCWGTLQPASWPLMHTDTGGRSVHLGSMAHDTAGPCIGA